MIELESVHIAETRGIRSLDISLRRKNFAISGPNGSGKSGVIDAIEFALTGEMKRLTGRGTKGLSVAEHGPHVDKVKFPGASFVELKVHIPKLGKSATIKRTIQSPRKPEITPDDPEVRAVFEAVSEHPEITLSRRDIIRFILVEPTQRSKEIQALLKLDQLGETRSALNTAQNRLQRAHAQAEGQVKEARRALQLHLQIDELKPALLLKAVNDKRQVLGLEPIAALDAATQLDAGLSTDSAGRTFNKASALRDIEALRALLPGLDQRNADAVQRALKDIETIEDDPRLLIMIQTRALIEKGLELVEGRACPLCDLPWEDEEHLRSHLEAKLTKSNEAHQLTERLRACGIDFGRSVTAILGVLGPVHQLAVSKELDAPDAAKLLDDWRSDLKSFKDASGTVDGLVASKDRLSNGWLQIPSGLKRSVDDIEQLVKAKPDQDSIVSAQTFLTTAQLRLSDYRKARSKEQRADNAAKAGKYAYETYCKVLEQELNSLYDDVQEDFSTFYRELNEDDEDSFTAKFTPSEGALGLDVNFYERGLFPPGAYHSEGHQDGMGVCLYLALMKRLFGDEFSFALLDDVVMSVDVDHRYQFCKLLKAHFPNTQFVLTTHDRVWAQQMKSAGLVTSKNALAFHGWSVDTGPLVESNDEIWNEINGALAKGKTDVAALSLRRHLEYFASHQCDHLGGRPQFKADGRYELGDLMPATLARLKDLLGKAIAAAQSWGNDNDRQAAVRLRDALARSSAASQAEQWAVNPAVHYNGWANLGKKDFAPVVASFRELLDLFHCKTCDSWIYSQPKSRPEALRCTCGGINFNLNAKPK